MNTLPHRPALENRQPRRIPGAVKILAAALLTFALTSSALAIDPPPAAAPQQRAWLLSHLVTDMQSVGTFSSDDIARMVNLLNSLTDEQVSLLTQYYYLTREKTEQDANLYAVQQTEGNNPLDQAEDLVADLLAQLQNQIEQTYAQLAAAGPGCETLCQFTYDSVPGWCAYNQYAIPDWYYTGGCYVGPVCSVRYCGPYAAPIYNVFYNRGSRYNWWRSRLYVHNNIARLGHEGRWNPAVSGTHPPYAVAHVGTEIATRHESLLPKQSELLVPKHSAPLPKVNYVPTSVATRDLSHFHDATSQSHSAQTTVRNYSAATVEHAQITSPAVHSQAHTVVHSDPRPAIHSTAPVQVHAAAHPQYTAHSQPPAQHAAQGNSDQGRHR